MVKIVYCITKKAELSDEEFFHYWKYTHGPIGARIPGLRRLVQSHRVTVSGDKRVSDYDGVAELWFDNLETPPGSSRIARVESFNRGRSEIYRRQQSCLLVSQEHVIFDTSVNKVKQRSLPNRAFPHLFAGDGGLKMPTSKQRTAAKKNIKKAAAAAKKKKTISHLPKATRTALGKQAAKVAKEKRRRSR